MENKKIIMFFVILMIAFLGFWFYNHLNLKNKCENQIGYNPMYEKIKGSYSWNHKWFKSREEALDSCIRNKGERTLSDFEKLSPEGQARVKENMNKFILDSVNKTQ